MKKLICIITSFLMSISMMNIPVNVVESKGASINDQLELWYDEEANINTAETNNGDWMKESLPLGNGDLGNLIFGGVAKERIHFNEKT